MDRPGRPAMKLSIAIAILILVVGAILGWTEEQKLTVAKEQRRTLVQQASALGIPTDLDAGEASAAGADKAAHTARRSRALREDSAAAAEARAYSEELIAFAIKFKAHQESGAGENEEIQKGIFLHLERLASLSGGQLEILIDEIKRNHSLDDDIRRGIVGLSIHLLAQQHPEKALIIAIEAADIYDNPDHAKGVVANALSKWAERDPLAALEWMRQNASRHPGIDSDKTKHGILKGAALQDPRLALKLVDELEFENRRGAGGTIAETARSSIQRSTLLEMLRKSAADDSDNRELLDGALASIGKSMAREGFDGSKTWLEENPLSPTEALCFFEGMHPHQTGDDTGHWIEWIDAQTERGEVGGPVDLKVHELMSGWTRADYAAAGEWLNNTDSLRHRKPASVHAYAHAVAPYDAPTAANWALTLPAGEHQDALLKEIHGHWKDQDEAAAARFAEQHGLER